jgi:hypothetical protein
MTATTNKSLNLPALNDPNWNVPLNDNFDIIDAALGGLTSINVTGVGTSPVTLTDVQYQNMVLKFTGTLTANVTYRVPSGIGGQWIVSNNTSGSFTLTIGSVGGGSSLTVAQGFARVVYSDGTNILPADDIVVSLPNNSVPYASGSTLLGTTNMTYEGSIFRVNRNDADDDTVLSAVRVSRSTSSVAANGIGVAIEFAAENASNAQVVGGLVSLVADDVTASSEDFRFTFQLVAGGAALATVAEITPTQILLGGNAVVTARSSTNTATQDIQYAGVVATADNDGTISSGTYTPTPVGGNFKRIVNGGAFTLAAPTASGDYTMIIQITNNASAGAITFSGFSKVAGDTLTTTNGHDFFIFVTKCNGFTSAVTQALQ